MNILKSNNFLVLRKLEKSKIFQTYFLGNIFAVHVSNSTTSILLRSNSHKVIFSLSLVFVAHVSTSLNFYPVKMASDDAMDVETATQGLYMDVEQQPPSNTGPSAETPPSSSNQTPGEDVQPRANDGSVPQGIADTILMARRVLVTFMMERRAEDIVPENSRVVIVDGNVRLRHAFRALLENGAFTCYPSVYSSGLTSDGSSDA